MSQEQAEAPEQHPTNKFNFNGVEIPSRLSIADIRQAKANHGVDLGVIGETGAMRLNSDILYLADALWGLYKNKLNEKSIATQEDFEEELSKSDLDEIRFEFMYAIKGFFPAHWTLYTMMRANPTGSAE